MTLAVEFRPEAANDVLDTRRWYEQQQAELGDAFADALEDIVYRIESMPRMYPAAHRDVRRGKLRRFPYLIYYRVFPNKIEVLAVLHGSRNPRVWRDRIN